MFVGGTSLYEITTTFWLKVAFIAFNQAVVIFFFYKGCMAVYLDLKLGQKGG